MSTLYRNFRFGALSMAVFTLDTIFSFSTI